MNFEMETLACIIQVDPMYLQGSFSIEEKGSQERECVRLMQCEKTWPVTAGYKEGRGHEPRNLGSLEKPGKTRKQILP